MPLLSMQASVLHMERYFNTSMNKKKHLLAATRLVLPTTGLCLICGGAYINSIQGDHLKTLREISMYLLIFLGFILLVFGVLWSVGHGMKSVWVKWYGSSTPDSSVFTVDRPNFYPPSYEESQFRNNVVTIPAVTQWPDSAPPVYTETCSETFTEDFSHEAPPTYQQAILQSQPSTCPPTNTSVEPV